MNHEEHTEKSFAPPGNLLLGLMSAAAMVLLIFYGRTLYNILQPAVRGEDTVPVTITDLFDSLFVAKEDLETVAAEYFALSPTDGEEEFSGDLQEGADSAHNFLTVRPYIALSYVIGDDLKDVRGYEITQVSRNYVEVSMLDIANRPIYPRICFMYRLSEDGSTITDYSFGRLQPFSRRHEEYSAVWNS